MILLFLTDASYARDATWITCSGTDGLTAVELVMGNVGVCRSVCRKQELAQLELEKAEDLVASKTSQRDQLVSADISLSSLVNLSYVNRLCVDPAGLLP